MTEELCVHCRKPAGRPVRPDGPWVCHACGHWQDQRWCPTCHQEVGGVTADRIGVTAGVLVDWPWHRDAALKGENS